MPQLLIVQRADRPEHTPEAEGLLVENVGASVRLVLDDGIEIIADRAALAEALRPLRGAAA